MPNSAHVQVDVAIIGASLAGATVAKYLSATNLTFALFDQEKFPRSKPCGEGLSHLAGELLQSLGIENRIKQLPKKPFYGFSIAASDKCRTTIKSISPRGSGIGRAVLDRALLASLEPTSRQHIYLGERVRSISQHNGSWKIESDCRRLSAETLIIATGVQSSLYRAPIFKTITTRRNKRLGYTFTAKLISGQMPDTVTIVPLINGEIYVTPITDRLINISIVGQKKLLQKYRGSQGFQAVRQRVRDVLLLECEMEWRGAGAAHFGERRQSTVDRLYLVGDACEAFDPACGLGMTHALATGTMVGRLLSLEATQNNSSRRIASEYGKFQRRLALRIRMFSHIISGLIFLSAHLPRIIVYIPGKALGWLHTHYEKIALRPAIQAALR